MDKNTEFEYKKDYLKRLVFNGFISATYSHEIIFESKFDNEEYRLNASLAHLTEAHNYHLNAQTFYVNNIDVFGERPEIESVFDCFTRFNKEFLRNVRTKHSHQWTDITFHELVNAFEPAASLLNIEKADFWIQKARN